MLSADRKMRNVQPTAELPLVHMPLTNAMPARPPRGPARNLTGLFLGSETKHAPQGLKNAVPPLARGRGMPSYRVKTPTEQRRYRKVELLRIKDDKRGFSGNPVKKPSTPKPRATSARKVTPDMNDQDIWEMTKQNARHFTASTNSGVTHFEYLAPEDKEFYPEEMLPLNETVAEDFQQGSITQRDLIGIVECYKKICRGNVDALFNPHPQKKFAHAETKGRQSTGFTVKSYRSPKQAEIKASFPAQEIRRPRTSTTGYIHRPFVPAPYFFKSYQPPNSAGGKLLRQDPFSDSILASPGAGHLSQSVARDRHNTSPRVQTPLVRENPGSKREQTPLAPTSTPTASRSQVDFTSAPAKEGKFEVALPIVDQNTVEIGESALGASKGEISSELAIKGQVAETEKETHQSNEPGAAQNNLSQDNLSETTTEKPDKSKMNSEGLSAAKQALNDNEPNSKPDGNVDNPPEAVMKKVESNSAIFIELEDESGEHKPVEIDVADEGPNEEDAEKLVDSEAQEESVLTPGRRVSITERVLKSRNSEQQLKILTESAEDRKKELAELLTEHAQIVHRVSSMEEVASPTSDKENDTFQQEVQDEIGENISSPQ